MNPVFNVCSRILVREFYKSNASFLLLVIGLAAGFMRAPDHIAMGEILISSPVLMAIPIFIWSAFALKVMLFNKNVMSHPENEFLYHLNIVDKKEKQLAVVSATATQFLLVYGYAIFLIALSIKHQQYDATFIIILSVAVLQFFLARAFILRINDPNQDKATSPLKRWIDKNFTKPLPVIMMEWVLRYRTLVFIGFKISSFLLLFGILKLYQGETYDHRLLCMGIMVAVGIHASFIYEIHRFENFHLGLLRQLPITFVKRVGTIVVVFFSALLPESSLLISQFPSNLTSVDQTNSILLMMSGMIFLYSILYFKDRNEEQLMPLVFVMTIGYLVLILFSVSILIIATTTIAAALFILKKYYFDFEYHAEKKE